MSVLPTMLCIVSITPISIPVWHNWYTADIDSSEEDIYSTLVPIRRTESEKV